MGSVDDGPRRRRSAHYSLSRYRHYIANQIFTALCRYPHALTPRDLAASVYPGREPYHAKASLQAIVWRMNRDFFPAFFPLLQIKFRDNMYRLMLRKP